MNKIVRFHRYEDVLESPDGIYVTREAIAIARCVLANDIDPDELFAAICLLIDASEV